MITALVLLAQLATAETVATCRVPDDPQQRVWALEQAGADLRVVFSAKSLDRPRVELPLPNARVAITGTFIHVMFASANGGRSIEWTIMNGPAGRLDLRVNHALEVNIERDLDPAVDLMNTEGELDVTCTIAARREPPAVSRAPSAESRGHAELMVAAGAARSVNLFESTAGRAYAVQTIGYARELTGDLSIIGIRGRFAWGVEAMPLFAQFSPSAIYGVGFAPLVWRWNFPEQRKLSVFAELSMGGLWTTDPIPDDSGRVNFVAHWGGGVRVWPRGRHALLLAYRFQHFSNGNQLGSNPGVNSHVFLAGLSKGSM